MVKIVKTIDKDGDVVLRVVDSETGKILFECPAELIPSIPAAPASSE